MFLLSSQQQKDKIIDYGIYSRYQVSNLFTDQPRKKSSYAYVVRRKWRNITIKYTLTICKLIRITPLVSGFLAEKDGISWS